MGFTLLFPVHPTDSKMHRINKSHGDCFSIFFMPLSSPQTLHHSPPPRIASAPKVPESISFLRTWMKWERSPILFSRPDPLDIILVMLISFSPQASNSLAPE